MALPRAVRLPIPASQESPLPRQANIPNIVRLPWHWEPARGEFLVPVAVLSRKIAAEFRAALKVQSPAVFAAIPAHVWQREWVSFCKHYGHGNDAVLSYLSRDVFRTAISNARILGMDETHVTFRWKDRGADAWRTERVPGVEFLRRFLQHVLPRGFHKVRYYGLWHEWHSELPKLFFCKALRRSLGQFIQRFI